jgi:hypothetical protein
MYHRAINARIENKLEKFPDIVDYCVECNQIFYAGYYTETYNRSSVVSIDRRWKWGASTGLKFDAKAQSDPQRPIPMMRFSTYDDTPLFRIPISVASLLETNAKAEEVRLQLGYISEMSENEQVFHLKFYEPDTLFSLLYDQEYALYSAAVHLAAGCLHIQDLVLAFRVASSIATLTLNLPSNLVQTIPVHRNFGAWGDRNEYMLLNNEYGFIYYSLLLNYQTTFEDT